MLLPSTAQCTGFNYFGPVKCRQGREVKAMEISKFMSDVFGEIDVFTDEEGELWFSGNQVAEALGYERPGDAIAALVDEEDRKALSYKAFGKSPKAGYSILWSKPNDFSNKTIISEYGMYALVMRSHASKAKEFQHWVTHEVLPSIRKHGAYINRQEELDKDQLAMVTAKAEKLADEVARLADENDFLKKRRHELIAERDKIKAKKNYLSRESDKRGDCIDNLLKMLNISYKDYDILASVAKDLDPDYMIRVLAKTFPKPAKTPIPGFTVTVAKDGMVISLKTD